MSLEKIHTSMAGYCLIIIANFQKFLVSLPYNTSRCQVVDRNEIEMALITCISYCGSWEPLANENPEFFLKIITLYIKHFFLSFQHGAQ